MPPGRDRDPAPGTGRRTPLRGQLRPQPGWGPYPVPPPAPETLMSAAPLRPAVS